MPDKPLLTDEEIEREHARQCQEEVDYADRTGYAVGWNHYRDFARRIESLVRKRLAERLRAHADMEKTDNPSGTYGCHVGLQVAANIVEED